MIRLIRQHLAKRRLAQDVEQRKLRFNAIEFTRRSVAAKRGWLKRKCA